MREEAAHVRFGKFGARSRSAAWKWHGCYVAREAKELTPSACVWARGKPAKGQRTRYGRILDRAVRVPDPFVHPYDGWLLRRLAPDCSRIELASLTESRDEERLLYSMGWETANIHFGTPRAISAIKRDLAKRPPTGFTKRPKPCFTRRSATGANGSAGEHYNRDDCFAPACLTQKILNQA